LEYMRGYTSRECENMVKIALKAVSSLCSVQIGPHRLLTSVFVSVYAWITGGGGGGPSLTVNGMLGSAKGADKQHN
jgi:hypothetical protein